MLKKSTKLSDNATLVHTYLCSQYLKNNIHSFYLEDIIYILNKYKIAIDGKNALILIQELENSHLVTKSATEGSSRIHWSIIS